MNKASSIITSKKVFFSMILTLVLISSAFADNPLPFYGADPNPIQGGDGKMYIFPTNSGPDGGDVKDWYVYSSGDLIEWENLGRIIGASDVSWAKGSAWAPAATYRNGMFYFYYYFHDANPRASVGVATSPNGKPPYTDRTKNKPLVSGLHDPAVFIDDDGQAYIFNSRKYYKLSTDMLSLSSNLAQFQYKNAVFPPEEGAFVFKRGNHYYMTQSPKAGLPNNNRAEHVIYYMSDKFTGPWTYKGIIMQAEKDQTRHASGYPYHGIYMLWYHILDNGMFHRRRPCAEYLKFNADGTIQKVTRTAEGVSYQDGNKPPMVDAGPDQSITLPTNYVYLSGSVTDDGLPNNTLQTNWSVDSDSGPGTVTFVNAANVNTEAAFSAPGLYSLKLTGNDSALSSSDIVRITVNPGGDDDDDDNHPANAVRLWPDADWKGNVALFTTGQYNQSAMVAAGMKNNDAHSIKVLPDYKATVYTGGNFDGSSKVFTADAPRLGGQFSNQVSSLIVEYLGDDDDDDDDDDNDDDNDNDNDDNDNNDDNDDNHPADAVRLWSDPSYKGKKALFTVGEYNQAALTAAGMKNNDAHSIKVLPGYEATVYTGSNFDGQSKVFTVDAPRLGGQFSNQISSIRVRYIGN